MINLKLYLIYKLKFNCKYLLFFFWEYCKYLLVVVGVADVIIIIVVVVIIIVIIVIIIVAGKLQAKPLLHTVGRLKLLLKVLFLN